MSDYELAIAVDGEAPRVLLTGLQKELLAIAEADARLSAARGLVPSTPREATPDGFKIGSKRWIIRPRSALPEKPAEDRATRR